MQMLDPMQPIVSVSPPEVLEIVKCGCSTDTPVQQQYVDAIHLAYLL